MSYKIKQVSASFIMKAEHQRDALCALQKLASKTKLYHVDNIRLKKSSTLTEALKEFSWKLELEEVDLTKTISVNAIKSILEELVKNSKDGSADQGFMESTLEKVIEKFPTEPNVIGIKFEGENNGSDKEIFEVIAPYVEEGSYIEMCGEEGEIWRWVFDGKTCVEKTPTVKW